MTAVTAPRPPATEAPPPGPADARGDSVGARVHGLLGAIPTMVLWVLVALWTVPTAGVFVSSFRPSLEVRTSGWWTDLPNPLPDRFGRAVLVAALICTVLWLLARAWTFRSDAVRWIGSMVPAVALPVLMGVVYPDVYETLLQGVVLVAIIAVAVVLFRVIGWLGGVLGGRPLASAAVLADVAVLSIVLAVMTAARLQPGAVILPGSVLVVAGLLTLLRIWGYRRGWLNGAGAVYFALGPLALVVAIVGVATGAEFTLDNYRAVFETAGSDAPNMWRHFLNSVAITLPATIIPIMIAAFAAYAFAWMDFKGRHWLFIGVVALLAVPFQMSLVPLVQLYNSGAHLTLFGETFTLIPDPDLAASRTSVWLTHIGFGLPLAVFLLHNYIASLPRDVFEAARIDGADHPTIFWRLVLPLSVPALAAFAIFQFLWVWNDYLVARTFLGSGGAGFDNAPMTIRLATLSGSRGQDWHLLTSAAFVSIMVPLIIFFALQRYFVRGLLAGSVKG